VSRIISVHSFRGGTGKSNTTANVASILASQGLRVCVIDTDIQSPGIHVLFNLNDDDVRYSLNDYLWGKCEIEDAAHDVTSRLGAPTSGQVFLVPSSMKTGEITRIVNQGYDPGLLSDGFSRLLEQLELDVLMVDTHPGLNEETLLSIAVSDVLAIIMRPDNQDFQGTSVTVEVARKLDIQRMVLVVNKVPLSLDLDAVEAQVEKIYNCEVAGVLPHSDTLMDLSSSGIFALRYPDHPVTATYKRIAAQLMV
jgi:septum site-determining protein MinD